MKKIIIITILMLSVGVQAQENDAISTNSHILGGFGLKIGDVFDIKTATGLSETISGEKLYFCKDNR